MAKQRYNKLLLSAASAATVLFTSCQKADFVQGSSPVVTYVGRVDSSSEGPRLWTAGAYFTFAYDGAGCQVVIEDQQTWGNGYNYLEFVVDDLPTTRVRTYGKRTAFAIGNATDATSGNLNPDTVVHIFPDLIRGKHHVQVVRDTETGMGFTKLVSISTDGSVDKWTPDCNLRLEFIGNSITCGAEAYCDEVPYKEGAWYDRHRAYFAYGPRTARNLNAQWSLTSVSGIGLIHSCCDMTITMPQVYDKVALAGDSVSYDFSYVPDVVCVCLGQNDGIQDSASFCDAYVAFVKDKIVASYPVAPRIVLLSSPMADPELRQWMSSVLPAVEKRLSDNGVKQVSHFLYSRSWNNGGGDHPDWLEHEQIADELTAYLKSVL